MGSRGQSLKRGGFTEYKYHTVARYGKVRYIVQNDSGANFKLTEMSNSPWAVYAGINRKGLLKTVSFYNGSRRKYKEIDLDNPHRRLSPHVHECDPATSLRIQGREPRPLTAKEKDKISGIVEFFRKHNLAQYAAGGGK